MDPQNLVDGAVEFGGKLVSVVRQVKGWTSPVTCVLVDGDVSANSQRSTGAGVGIERNNSAEAVAVTRVV